jgi:RNA polymerase sigma factor (sigma-70 family)
MLLTKHRMDEELIEGILRKDKKMILTFIQSNQDRVYSQAYRMLGNTQDAEEASQDTFIKALKKIDGFQGGSKLSTWIYRIGYTTCLDVLKKRKAKPKVLNIDDSVLNSWASVSDSLQTLELKEQRSIIDAAVKELEETDALLIDLYHLQEIPITEISEITGMGKSAIKVRLMRARKKLAVHLETRLPLETIKKLKK